MEGFEIWKKVLNLTLQASEVACRPFGEVY